MTDHTETARLRPPPEGFEVAMASWDDLDRVAALYRLSETDRTGSSEVRTEDVRYRWLERGGPDDDTMLVLESASGQLVGYGEFSEDTDPWTDDLDLHVEAIVHPSFLGRGLATFLMQRAEDRARRAVAASDAHGTVLRTTVVAGDDDAIAWHQRRGFVPVRHFLRMQLDLSTQPPAPTPPPGVDLRPVAPDELADVHRAHQRAFADLATTLPQAYEDWFEERIERDPAHDLGLWFVAVADDTIVGVCLARPGTPEAPEVGDVRDLGVVPAWRRRGVAMALLRTALRAFHARGLTGAALEVDDVTLEGAVRLYRAAGMRVARRTDVLELPL